MNRDAAQDGAVSSADTQGGPLAAAPTAPPWLLRYRTTIPGRSSGFLHRERLALRSAPTTQRVTLLMAPGGFGKTTLLAACCRDALERGITVAWLTLNESDTPDMLDTYLAYAFQAAGLDVLEPFRTGAAVSDPPHPRTALLLRAIKAHGAPVVLALDELEQLTDPKLTALVDLVLRGAPDNLHVALAGRQLPRRLDLSAPVLEGDAPILTAEDLRFTRDEIAGFFDQKLSRRELADVVSASGGWPIALQVYQNQRHARPTAESRVVRDIVENWINSRFWRSFDETDEQLVLDVALFDWVDAELLENVLREQSPMQRLRGIRALDGLFTPVPNGRKKVWQLHPLIREHCRLRRKLETPARYRSMHDRIARALARRGRIASALRHAVDADDASLLATIFMDAGGVRLWLSEGTDRLVALGRYLTDEAVARCPRLAAARCAALAGAGRLAEARRILADIPVELPEGATADDVDLYLDRSLARGLIAVVGCESYAPEEAETKMTRMERFAETPSFDLAMRGAMALARCVSCNRHALFDESMQHGLRLRKKVAGRIPFLTVTIDTQLGLIAMAQGRVREAESHYGESRRVAMANFLQQPSYVMLVGILIDEMNLERNRFETDAPHAIELANVYGRAESAICLAATDVVVELDRLNRGIDHALATLADLLTQARRIGLPALERHLAALHVSLLADVGRIDEAQQAWVSEGLPETDAGCLDLVGQSWREAESVSCARLRLLIARGEFDAGRALGRRAMRVAEECGLKRTNMRVRVLCLRLEHRAGNAAAAIKHLDAFLELFAETDFTRALVQEGAIAGKVLKLFLRTRRDSPHRNAAEGLLTAIDEASAVAGSRFSQREMEVLRRLETDRDDDIGAALGITRYGVRYHVGNIFGKLDVHTRRECVRRARALGILPPTRQRT